MEYQNPSVWDELDPFDEATACTFHGINVRKLINSKFEILNGPWLCSNFDQSMTYWI